MADVNQMREKARQQRKIDAQSFFENRKDHDREVPSSDRLFSRPPAPVSSPSDPLSARAASALGEFVSVRGDIMNGSVRLIGDYTLPTTPVVVGDKRLFYPGQDQNGNTSAPTSASSGMKQSETTSSASRGGPDTPKSAATLDRKGREVGRASVGSTGSVVGKPQPKPADQASNKKQYTSVNSKTGLPLNGEKNSQSTTSKSTAEISSTSTFSQPSASKLNLEISSTKISSSDNTGVDPELERIFESSRLPPRINAFSEESTFKRDKNDTDPAPSSTELKSRSCNMNRSPFRHIGLNSQRSSCASSVSGSPNTRLITPFKDQDASSSPNSLASAYSPKPGAAMDMGQNPASDVSRNGSSLARGQMVDAIGFISDSSVEESPRKASHSDDDNSSYDGISSAHEDMVTSESDEDLDEETKLKLKKAAAKRKTLPTKSTSHVRAEQSKEKSQLNTTEVVASSAKNNASKNSVSKTRVKAAGVNKKTEAIISASKSLSNKPSPVNSIATKSKTINGKNGKAIKSAEIIASDSSSDEEDDIKTKSTDINSLKNNDRVEVKVKTDIKVNGIKTERVSTPTLPGLSTNENSPVVMVHIDTSLLTRGCGTAGEKIAPAAPKAPAYSPETLNRLMGITKSTKVAMRIPKKVAGADEPAAKRSRMNREDNNHRYDHRDSRGWVTRDDSSRNRHRDGYHGSNHGNPSPFSIASDTGDGGGQGGARQVAAYDDMMSDGEVEYDPPVRGGVVDDAPVTLNEEKSEEMESDKEQVSYKKIGNQWGSIVSSLTDAPTERNTYTDQWQRKHYSDRRGYHGGKDWGRRYNGGRRDYDADSVDSTERGERRQDRRAMRPRRRSAPRSPGSVGSRTFEDEEGGGVSGSRNDVIAPLKETAVAEVQTCYSLPTEPRLDTKAYYTEARKLKHIGDKAVDPFEKVLMYTEAILCFIQQAAALDKATQAASIDKIFMETVNFSKAGFSKYFNQKQSGKHWVLIMVLVYRINSFLYYQLYRMRRSECGRAKTTMDEILVTSSVDCEKLVPSVKRYLLGMEQINKCLSYEERADALSNEIPEFFALHGEISFKVPTERFIAYVKDFLSLLKGIVKSSAS